MGRGSCSGFYMMQPDKPGMSVAGDADQKAGLAAGSYNGVCANCKWVFFSFLAWEPTRKVSFPV